MIPTPPITGQHRYELSYVQPTAGIEAERLELDVIYTGEQFETERFEVVVNGFELDGATCTFGGSEFDQNTCELAPADDGTLRTVIAPSSVVTGSSSLATSPPPPRRRRSTHHRCPTRHPIVGCSRRF
ncbi:MAG: hypothetical protein WKF58_13240 [Ilumatobacteraceae bacterium]